MTLKSTNYKIAIAVVLLLAAISGIWYYLDSRNYIYTDDAYISGHSSLISPHVSGYVNKICVDDNQLVKKGQLLLSIDPKPFIEQVRQCEAAENVALDQLQSDIHLESLQKARLKFSMEEFVRYKRLAECHAQSIETYQNYKSLLLQEIEAIKAKLMQIQKDKASVKQSEADLALAKINLSYTRIYAPFDGWITKKTTALGNYVSPGVELMAVVPENLYIQANYKETKLTNLKSGQSVKIQIDSYPGVFFTGHVDSLQSGSGAAFSLLPPENATGNFVKIVQRVPVKIVFDKLPDPEKYKLSIGMSVETTVKIS